MTHRHFTRFTWLLLTLWLSISTAASDAASFSVTSPATRVTLVELFTSEGCSSCPPADRWLSGLQQAPGLWRDFIPVAFHVDYWDYIGWPDRFASPAYTTRQRTYAAQQSMRTIYTPGVFRNGKEWRQWRRQPGESVDDGTPGALSLNVDGQIASVRFDAAEKAAAFAVTVALLGFDIETKVKAGENSGRTLAHDFVVLALAQTGLDRIEEGNAVSFYGTLARPESPINADRQALVAWVSAAGSQDPIQAVGGWFKN